MDKAKDAREYAEQLRKQVDAWGDPDGERERSAQHWDKVAEQADR